MALNAGSAYSEYTLRYDEFLKGLDAVEAAYTRSQKRLEGLKPPSLSGDTAGARQAADLAKLNATIAQQQAKANAANAQSATVAAVAEARLATAENQRAASALRLVAAEQNNVTATQRAAAAASNAAAAQDRAAVAALRRAQAEEAAANGTSRASGLAKAFAGGVVELAGSFGLVTSGAAAAAVAVQGLISAFNLRASLVDTQQQFRTLFGDVDAANQKIDEAAAFADKYRIKQSEINTTLAAGAALFRDSSAATETQLSALSRLASLNAAEGINGAVFALKELTAASTEGEGIQSLVERFNLSKDTARQLFQEVQGGKDVFVALDGILNQLNVTEDVLLNRTTGVVGAQNAAAKATEDFALTVGQLVEGPGTALLNFYTQAAQGATLLAQQAGGQATATDQASASILAASTSYADYTAKVQAAQQATQAYLNAKQAEAAQGGATVSGVQALINLYVQATSGIQQLTQSEYTYTQALLARGVAEADAVAKSEAQSAALGNIQAALDASQGALDAYAARIGAAGAASDQSLATLNALALAYRQNKIDLDGFVAGLTAVETATRAQTEADRQAAAEAERLASVQARGAAEAENSAAKAAQDAFAKLEQTAATQQAAAAQEQLEAALRTAAAATGDVGPLVDFLVSKYGLERAKVLDLIAVYRELNAQRGSSRGTGFGGTAPADVARSERVAKNTQDVLLATGDTATQLRIVQSRLRGVSADSSDYANLRIREQQLIEKQAKEAEQAAKGAGRTRGGGGGGGGASPAQKLAEKEQSIAEANQRKLQDIEERAYEARAAAEQRYQERVLEIQQQYAERQLAAQRDLQVESAASRADFYDSLTQADIPPEVAQQLSAAYEAAFAEAQRLSQEGKAALANDYLALKQEQLAAEQKYQEELQKAREKGDKAEIERLQRIKELRDREFQARESNLMAQGDQNVTQRDEALSDAEQQRIEALAEAEQKRQEAIADAAETAQARVAEAQRKAEEQAAKTTLQYQAQIDALTKLGQLPPTPATPTPGAAQAAAAPPPRPTLPEAQAAAQTPALPAAGAVPGAPVPVTYPELLAAFAAQQATLAVLSDVVTRLAGAVEGPTQTGLSAIASAVNETTRAVRAGTGRTT